eukprot:Partr_v1_DN28534_c0_g1_i1_m73880 putative Oral-facial-digital syndrome 1
MRTSLANAQNDLNHSVSLTTQKPKTVDDMAIESLILDYLQSKQYEFSISVFMPECGLNRRQVMKSEDVLQTFCLNDRLDPHPAGTALLSDCLEYCRVKFGHLVSIDTQTDMELSTQIHNRLTSVDVQYEMNSKAGVISNQASLEQRMNNYQKECDKRVEEETREAVERIKIEMINEMRMEERNRFQIELDNMKTLYDGKSQERKQQLESMESEMIARLRRKETEMEKEVYAERQRLLHEFDAFKTKEENMKKEAELGQKSLQLLEEKARRKFEDAVQKFNEAQRDKENFSVQLRDAIQKHQLQFDRDHGRALVELREETAKLKTERAIIQEKNDQFDFYKEQCTKLSTELSLSKEAYHKLDTDVAMLRKENEILKAALHETKSSSSMLHTESRNHTVTLEQETSALKRNIIEMEKLIASKDTEILALKQDQSALQSNLHKMKKYALKCQKQVQLIHMRFDSQITENEELIKTLDNESVRNKELSREIANVRLLLHHAQTALQHGFSATYGGDPAPIDLELENMVQLKQRISQAQYRPEPFEMKAYQVRSSPPTVQDAVQQASKKVEQDPMDISELEISVDQKPLQSQRSTVREFIDQYVESPRKPLEDYQIAETPKALHRQPATISETQLDNLASDPALKKYFDKALINQSSLATMVNSKDDEDVEERLSVISSAGGTQEDDAVAEDRW